MKATLHLRESDIQSLSNSLRGGIFSYATDHPNAGTPTTLWLHLNDGATLKIQPEMHDLSGWDEIGTLSFDFVDASDAPRMTPLPTSWLDIRSIEMLLFESGECIAESGIKINSMGGESLTILPGADVYTLAIDAPFYSQAFNPENDFVKYVTKKV